MRTRARTRHSSLRKSSWATLKLAGRRSSSSEGSPAGGSAGTGSEVGRAAVLTEAYRRCLPAARFIEHALKLMQPKGGIVAGTGVTANAIDVVVETGAGAASSFPDEDYAEAGASVLVATLNSLPEDGEPLSFECSGWLLDDLVLTANQVSAVQMLRTPEHIRGPREAFFTGHRYQDFKLIYVHSMAN